MKDMTTEAEQKTGSYLNSPVSISFAKLHGKDYCCLGDNIYRVEGGKYVLLKRKPKPRY